MFQFTLPRGERLLCEEVLPGDTWVSIHAPAGGATGDGGFLAGGVGVSIHAPAGGATSLEAHRASPRRVSIHAPAGGATGKGSLLTRGPPKFQFTLPRGERQTRSRRQIQTSQFQFTLPRGERLAGDAARDALDSFNSRSRGGSDPPKTPPSNSAKPFQFTLPRGERRLVLQSRVADFVVSIHAPAGGATGRQGRHRSAGPRFNSRSRGGSDLSLCPSRCGCGSFNSRSRGGSDGDGRNERGVVTDVSIHAPAGGATAAGTEADAPAVVSIHAPAGGATHTHGLPSR